jgi:hypothetical protein
MLDTTIHSNGSAVQRSHNENFCNKRQLSGRKKKNSFIKYLFCAVRTILFPSQLGKFKLIDSWKNKETQVERKERKRRENG